MTILNNIDKYHKLKPDSTGDTDIYQDQQFHVRVVADSLQVL